MMKSGPHFPYILHPLVGIPLSCKGLEFSKKKNLDQCRLKRSKKKLTLIDKHQIYSIFQEEKISYPKNFGIRLKFLTGEHHSVTSFCGSTTRLNMSQSPSFLNFSNFSYFFFFPKNFN